MNNREIKFRVYDSQAKMFFYWGFINEAFVGLTSNSKNPKSLRELKELSQQFTGLSDKSGVEIYEGDIVEVKYSDGSGYDNPVEVNFENGSFWAGAGYLNNIKIIEVIGNVFENKNLIEKI
jgi:hypothetical protein